MPEINAEAAIVKLVVWEGHPAVPSGNRAFAVLHAKTPGTQSTPGKSGNSGTRAGLTSRCANPGLPAPPITHLEEKRLRVRYTRGV
jgi:hypothetical protein